MSRGILFNSFNLILLTCIFLTAVVSLFKGASTIFLLCVCLVLSFLLLPSATKVKLSSIGQIFEKRFLNLSIKYKWTFVSCVLLVIPIFSIGNTSLFLVFANLLIIYLIVVVVAKLPVINLITISILSLLIGTEITYYLIYHERVSLVILDALIDEISYGPSVAYRLFIISFFIGILLFLFLYKSGREIQKLSLVKYTCLLIIILIVSITSFGSFICLTYQNHRDERTKSDFWTSPMMDMRYDVYKAFPLLIGNSFYIASHFVELAKIQGNISHKNVFPGMKLQPSNNNPLKIIIILGETSLRTHYSLYGYSFYTTPSLDELYKQGKIIKVDNVISPAPITRESLRLTLSYDTPFDKSHFYEYKNIVEMANMAGYKTIWLSTARDFGINGSYVGMIQRSASEYYDPTNDEILKSEQDKVLPSQLEKFYKEGEKQVFILHLQGSHMPYFMRYDKDEMDLVTTKQATDYDRSILHTDRLLANIINIVKRHDENTILYYYSDHGEIINSGHGMVYLGGANQYEIPLLVFQNRNNLSIQRIIEKYRSQNGILNNLNSHYIVAELMGYVVDGHIVQRAKKEGEYIYHSNGNVLKYNDFLKKKFIPQQHIE